VSVLNRHSPHGFGAKTVQFTDLAVKRLPPGTHWEKSGLGIRVGKQARTFIVLVASGRRQTIGRYGIITLQEARHAAKRLKAEATLGRIRPTHTAYADAVARFLDEKKHLKPKTHYEYRRLLHRFPFGRQSIATISRQQISRALSPLPASEKQHAFTVLSVMLRWATRQGILDRSPTENMAPPPLGRPRSRVLSEDELRALWRHVRTPRDNYEAIVALLILTGQRRGEIARLQWDWIRGDSIEFPASVTKNGQAHRIPTGQTTSDLFGKVSKMVGSPLVFPGRTGGVINGWGKCKARLDREVRELSGSNWGAWTLHDIRRTYATAMQRLGVRLEVTETLLNHASGSRSGIVGLYQRYGFEKECWEAVLQYEKWLSTLLLKP
jgi:integrase